jgi:hypothetical protein
MTLCWILLLASAACVISSGLLLKRCSALSDETQVFLGEVNVKIARLLVLREEIEVLRCAEVLRPDHFSDASVGADEEANQ